VRLIASEERRTRLALRHLLVPDHRTDDVATACDSVVCLHSSDPASVFLSAALRLRAASLAAVETALYDDRTLIRHHSMRRTIWVMTPTMAAAAHGGFSRKLAAREAKRYGKLFGREETWFADAIDRVATVVEEAGRPISTRDVGAELPDLAEPIPINQGTTYEGRMAPHTRALLSAAFEGRIVRDRPAGSWIASQYSWVASSEWDQIDWHGHDELSGATEVVRRWLDRFGPGTLTDLVWWTGGTKTLLRTALTALDAVEVQLEDGLEPGYVLPGDDGAGSTVPWVALLPGLDPTAMGWKQRNWYLDPHVAARVTDRNGNIGPTVWADGRIVGGWAQRPDGTIAHDAKLTADQHDLLTIEIDRLRELVGDTRFSPRFPAPNQAGLLRMG